MTLQCVAVYCASVQRKVVHEQMLTCRQVCTKERGGKQPASKLAVAARWAGRLHERS